MIQIIHQNVYVKMDIFGQFIKCFLSVVLLTVAMYKIVMRFMQ
jgi:hypothetical protein